MRFEAVLVCPINQLTPMPYLPNYVSFMRLPWESSWAMTGEIPLD